MASPFVPARGDLEWAMATRRTLGVARISHSFPIETALEELPDV